MRIKGRLYKYDDKGDYYIKEFSEYTPTDLLDALKDSYDKDLFEFVRYIGDPIYPEAMILRRKREVFFNAYNELVELTQKNENLLEDIKNQKRHNEVLKNHIAEKTAEIERLNSVINALIAK